MNDNNFENVDLSVRSNIRNKLLTITEIAEFLDVPTSTIYKWTHTQFIPHFKLRNKLRFDIDDIKQWLHTKRVK